MRRTVVILLVFPVLAVCRQARPLRSQLQENLPVMADSTTGAINGTVIDDECGVGLRYANIVIVGTRLGAMSGTDGRFSISGVPTGIHRVKAMMAGYGTAEMESVRVLPSHGTRVEFALQGLRADAEEARGDRRAVAPDCTVHHIPTEIVLVPIGYGLKVIDPEYQRLRQREFPNAEPYADDGCVISPGVLLKAWEPRCRMCIAARNRHLVGTDFLDREPPIPANWQTYRVGDVSFSAPPAVTRHADITGCGRTDRLDAGSLSILAYFGSRNHIPELPRDRKGRGGGRIISGVYADIAVDSGENGVTVVDRVSVLPLGANSFVISISSNEDTDVDSALAVVHSVRFRME